MFSSHSPSVAALANQLDYQGIILLIWGATIPAVFYGFHDEAELQKLYCLVVSAEIAVQLLATNPMQISLLATLCSIATFEPRFRTPAFRTYRAAMYASLGLSGLVPVAHGIMLHGLKEQRCRMGLDWLLLTALVNLLGAITYAARVGFQELP